MAQPPSIDWEARHLLNLGRIRPWLRLAPFHTTPALHPHAGRDAGEHQISRLPGWRLADKVTLVCAVGIGPGSSSFETLSSYTARSGVGTHDIGSASLSESRPSRPTPLRSEDGVRRQVGLCFQPAHPETRAWAYQALGFGAPISAVLRWSNGQTADVGLTMHLAGHACWLCLRPRFSRLLLAPTRATPEPSVMRFNAPGLAILRCPCTDLGCTCWYAPTHSGPVNPINTVIGALWSTSRAEESGLRRASPRPFPHQPPPLPPSIEGTVAGGFRPRNTSRWTHPISTSRRPVLLASFCFQAGLLLLGCCDSQTVLHQEAA